MRIWPLRRIQKKVAASPWRAMYSPRLDVNLAGVAEAGEFVVVEGSEDGDGAKTRQQGVADTGLRVLDGLELLAHELIRYPPVVKSFEIFYF